MKLDWRVVLGAMGILVLIFIGSYFGSHWRYQSDDERLKPPPTIGKVPTTPMDSHPTDPDSAPEIVTSDEEVSFEATEAADASDAAEAEQLIRESIVQLRVKKTKVEAEIDRITNLSNELTKQRSRHYEHFTEMGAKEKALEIEVNRLVKIVEEKVGPNPTLKEYQSIEEWHQLGKLLRENDPLPAFLAAEEVYDQKFKEIEQKTDELFEERSVIMDEIKDLASQLVE